MKPLRDLRQYWNDRFGRIAEEPIIVLGNQKSGTSAIAHLLADAAGLSKTVDIPALWLPTAAEILRGNIRFSDVLHQNRSAFATGLIKEPWLTFFADQVMECFPRAKYVFVLRDPRDNIRSFLSRRDIPGNLEQVDEATLPPDWRGNVFDPLLWGGSGENYVGVLAHRWNKSLAVYKEHRRRIVLAKYEEFMRDKAGFISRLAESLGLAPSVDIKDRVDVPYQPSRNRDVKWLDFFGSRNLGRIETVCAAGMAEFDYQPSFGEK